MYLDFEQVRRWIQQYIFFSLHNKVVVTLKFPSYFVGARVCYMPIQWNACTNGFSLPPFDGCCGNLQVFNCVLFRWQLSKVSQIYILIVVMNSKMTIYDYVCQRTQIESIEKRIRTDQIKSLHLINASEWFRRFASQRSVHLSVSKINDTYILFSYNLDTRSLYALEWGSEKYISNQHGNIFFWLITQYNSCFFRCNVQDRVALSTAW